MTTQVQKKEQGQTSLTANAEQVAAILGISVRHTWRLHQKELLPRPVRFGKSVRWLRSEIQAFLDAGAPSREKWEQLKNVKETYNGE